MTDIVLASHNQGKVSELRSLLEPLGSGIRVLSLSDIGYTGDLEENGRSFCENSLIKAALPASRGYIGMADDSGLCVDALGGAPGIYSARYSGQTGTGAEVDAANRRRLVSELHGAAPSERGGAFVCVISLVLPEGCGIEIPERYRPPEGTVLPDGVSAERCATVRGECRGVILTSERGCGGFGYDSLFESCDLGKTFAEASHEEKNRISHRGRAMEKFTELLGSVPGLL